jgi:excisionase family DNA binding protein
MPVSPSVLVPLELTPAVRRFLLGALVGEARRWRADGLRPPSAVVGLIDWLSRVQEGSEVASPGLAPEPVLVSREVAARRLGVSLSTVKRMLAAEPPVLTARRVGRRVMISVDELDGLLRGLR